LQRLTPLLPYRGNPLFLTLLCRRAETDSLASQPTLAELIEGVVFELASRSKESPDIVDASVAEELLRPLEDALVKLKLEQGSLSEMDPKNWTT
jgi:hypothetical protein